ncbi:MAG: PilZ domain-containing protein [Terriglobales bacterium]
MTGPISSPRNPINTRRWPRFHVHLPVLIAAETADSQIAIPGMVSAISRAGMEVYGGVPLRPGDLMEVEFRAPGTVRVAGIVRNRSGYCFGLEFLRLTAIENSPDNVLAPEFAPETALPEWAGLDIAELGSGLFGPELVEAAAADETLAALFIERHQSFLRASQKEIDRLRRGALQIRTMREAMERLLERRASGQ